LDKPKRTLERKSAHSNEPPVRSTDEGDDTQNNADRALEGMFFSTDFIMLTIDCLLQITWMATRS
jgi:hypothetical protein